MKVTPCAQIYSETTITLMMNKMIIICQNPSEIGIASARERFGSIGILVHLNTVRIRMVKVNIDVA